MPKGFFLLNERSFEGKYKIAKEMEQHRKRLQEIKHSHGAIDNSQPISRKRKQNYKHQVNKYKLTERQKNNLLLFHRLKEIEEKPGYVKKYYIKNKTKDLASFKKKLAKLQKNLNKKRIESQNEITRQHIKNMIASDDLRIDLLKKHWRKHLNRKKMFNSQRKRDQMKPSDIKKIVNNVTNKISKKQKYKPLQTSQSAPRFDYQFNTNTPKNVQITRKSRKKKRSPKTARNRITSPKQLTKSKAKYNIPEINTKTIQQLNKENSVTTDRVRRATFLRVDSARRTMMSPASILGASKEQVIEHSKYLQNKNNNRNKSSSHKGIDVYLNTDVISPNKNKKAKLIKSNPTDAKLYRSDYLWKINDR